MTGFYNRDGVCLLCGTDWILKYNSSAQNKPYFLSFCSQPSTFTNSTIHWQEFSWEKFRTGWSKEYNWFILFPQSLQNLGLWWRIASVLKVCEGGTWPFGLLVYLDFITSYSNPHGVFRKPDLFPSSGGGVEWHLPSCVRTAYHSNCTAYSTSIVFLRSCL